MGTSSPPPSGPGPPKCFGTIKTLEWLPYGTLRPFFGGAWRRAWDPLRTPSTGAAGRNPGTLGGSGTCIIPSTETAAPPTRATLGEPLPVARDSALGARKHGTMVSAMTK